MPVNPLLPRPSTVSVVKVHTLGGIVPIISVDPRCRVLSVRGTKTYAGRINKKKGGGDEGDGGGEAEVGEESKNRAVAWG